MYNLRYHVASLVSVFLFLAVGLVLGTIVAERGPLDTQLDTMISSLRAQYEDLSAENSDLRAENEAREDFVNDILPLITSGRLDGQAVVVLSNTGRTDGLSVVADTISNAGGMPVIIMVDEPGLGLADPAVSQIATAYVDVTPTEDVDAFRSAVAEELTREWLSPGIERPLTEALVAAGVLSVDEFPAEFTSGGFVTMTTFDGVADEGCLSIAAAAAVSGVPAVGVVGHTQITDMAEAAVARGLSIVDNVGTPEGNYSLVMILSGEASGSYGTSSSATKPYPLVAPAAAP